MPRIEQRVVVQVPVDDAFVLSQSQREVRYAWDPFVSRQELLKGATTPDRGVQTLTKSKHGFSMVSEYTSLRRPEQVGMKMVSGPPFFSAFGGGWAFRAIDDNSCEVIWRYTFTIKPAWLSKIADPIGKWVLGKDIRKRIDGFAAGCADPELIARARAQLDS